MYFERKVYTWFSAPGLLNFAKYVKNFYTFLNTYLSLSKQILNYVFETFLLHIFNYRSNSKLRSIYNLCSSINSNFKSDSAGRFIIPLYRAYAVFTGRAAPVFDRAPRRYKTGRISYIYPYFVCDLTGVDSAWIFE